MSQVSRAMWLVVLSGGMAFAQISEMPQNSGAAGFFQDSHASGAQANTAAAAPSVSQIPPNTVIPAELTKSIDAKKAKPGDPVTAKTVQDLLAKGQVVIPRGSKVIGHITQAQARAKSGSDSMLGVAFDRIQIGQNNELPLSAEIQALAKPEPATGFGDNDDNRPQVGQGTPTGGGFPGASPGARTSPGINPQPGAIPGATSPRSNSSSPTVQGQPQARLSAASHGVIGMKDYSLQPGTGGGVVISSSSQNVKLESGTELILHVK